MWAWTKILPIFALQSGWSLRILIKRQKVPIHGVGIWCFNLECLRVSLHFDVHLCHNCCSILSMPSLFWLSLVSNGSAVELDTNEWTIDAAWCWWCWDRKTKKKKKKEKKKEKDGRKIEKKSHFSLFVSLFLVRLLFQALIPFDHFISFYIHFISLS